VIACQLIGNKKKGGKAKASPPFWCLEKTDCSIQQMESELELLGRLAIPRQSLNPHPWLHAVGAVRAVVVGGAHAPVRSQMLQRFPVAR
jgi:hypothetical protein